MRTIREISAEEERFRLEPIGKGVSTPRRDPVEPESFRIDTYSQEGVSTPRRDPIEPEPRGTIILIPFRIDTYSQDCDGSLMANLRALGLDGETTGWSVERIGLYPETGLVVTREELKRLKEL